MLYNSLTKGTLITPKDSETTELFKKYEQQRKYFLDKRINEIKEYYAITENEERTLLGYFNTEERKTIDDKNGANITYKILRIFKHHKDDDELLKNEIGYSASLGWLRIYWSKAWIQFCLDYKYTLSARFALIYIKDKNISEDTFALAVEELSKDIKSILHEAEKNIGIPIKDSHLIEQFINKNGILDIDHKKLEWLIQNNTGNATKKYIEEFKILLEDKNYNIEHRLDIWDNPLYFSRQLAILRWQDIISKLVKRKKDNIPALTYQFFIQINEITKRNTLISEDNLHIINKEGKTISAIGKTPKTTISTIQQITKSNLSILSSITSHYLWRWLIEQAHKQHLLDIEQPYLINIIGGYSELGKLSDAGTSKIAVGKIRQVIELSSMCNYLYNGKTGIFKGNLVSYEYFEAYGRKSSRLVIQLARPLCPGFVEELPDGNSKYNHQKILIPWVKMPVLIGKNPGHHAPQSSFQLDMLTKMRLRATEIYERGGILINDKEMMELANGAKLSPDLVNRVIDTWVNEEYLERIDSCVYMLGKRYPEARESLFTAGEISIKSAEKGRQRKRAKKARIIKQHYQKS